MKGSGSPLPRSAMFSCELLFLGGIHVASWRVHINLKSLIAIFIKSKCRFYLVQSFFGVCYFSIQNVCPYCGSELYAVIIE